MNFLERRKVVLFLRWSGMIRRSRDLDWKWGTGVWTWDTRDHKQRHEP